VNNRLEQKALRASAQPGVIAPNLSFQKTDSLWGALDYLWELFLHPFPKIFLDIADDM